MAKINRILESIRFNFNSGRKNSGFSIIELLVAVAILGFSLLPIAFSFSAGTRGIQMGVDEFQAHSAALELLEQTISIPFSMLPCANFNNTQIQEGMPLSPSFPFKFRISPVPGIERELKIEDIVQNNLLRMKKVSVTISWQVPDRLTKKSFTVKSLVANENP
ncbi:MAG: type II secretion system protein [Candidatus Riflebacteria bacterium]|nr:type II secretion system protein [Candidatus Riflebacteria bacterium]